MKYEIWLSDDYSYFGRGIAYFSDGRKLALKAWLNSSSYGRDSVLIDDEEHYSLGRFLLRWFVMENGLEFYGVDKDTPVVLFHNESGRDIRIDNFGVLPNGESKHVLPYVPVVDERIHYRVCRIRCTSCGDVLEHTFRTKDAGSAGLRWCSCGKTALDPHPFAYRILGDCFEDLSETWK